MTTKKYIGKQLLSNHVRHAESHNKVQEERDMWQQRERQKNPKREREEWSSFRSRARDSAKPLSRGYLISDSLSLSPSPSPPPLHDAHCSDSAHHDPSKSANYWMKALMKAKESDPTRWGHSGYKEQHPEVFASEDEPERKDAHTAKKKRQKRRRKESAAIKKTKRGKMKKLKRGEFLSSSCSSSEDSDDSDCSSSSESDGDRERTRKEKKRKRRERETGDRHKRRRKKRRKEKHS